MPDITLTFDVQDVDPLRLDPAEVADYLFGLHDVAVKSGNHKFFLAEDHIESEWVDG